MLKGCTRAATARRRLVEVGRWVSIGTDGERSSVPTLFTQTYYVANLQAGLAYSISIVEFLITFCDCDGCKRAAW